MPSSPTSELGEELYVLMLKAHGATAAAIQRMPRLMSLNYVRAGVPELETPEAIEEAMAVNARKVLTEATEDLAKPPDEREPIDEVDNGAAARVYLAIEPGTETLLLKDRRERATIYTGKPVRVMAHAQEGRRSHEYNLMASLAGRLIDREIEFVARNHPPILTTELHAVHQAWRAVHSLGYQLMLYDIFHSTSAPSWGGDLNDTLALFGGLWQVVEAPSEDTFDFSPDQVPTSLDNPQELLYLLRLASPFDQAALNNLSRCIQEGPPVEPPDDLLAEEMEIKTSSARAPVFVRPSVDDDALVRYLVEHWQKWLEGCLCEMIVDRNPFCRQHRFRRALDLYKGKLEGTRSPPSVLGVMGVRWRAAGWVLGVRARRV
jgi:hypothetical protein